MDLTLVTWFLRYAVAASIAVMAWGFLFLFLSQSVEPPDPISIPPVETRDEPEAEEEVSQQEITERVEVFEESQDPFEPEESHESEESHEPEEPALEVLEESARPVNIEIPMHNIAAVIDATGPSYGLNRFNPARGRIDFWLEPGTAKPCEAGPSFMLGHVTDVFADLTTGPADNQNHGVALGSEVIVTLKDSTQCIFKVIEFDLAIGENVPGTPAHRVRKNDWSQTYWEEAIHSSSERAVLFLLTSSGTEVEPSGHRAHNDIVMAELTEIRMPNG